jgi:PTH1 family peptidyl-tRNA hydrolase
MGLEIKNCVLPKQLSLIVGLGNPGGAYDKTRHNAGFMAADKLAATFGVAFEKQKFDVVYGRGLVESARVILAKPMAFMNLSGPPIKKLANFYKIPSEDILVVRS